MKRKTVCTAILAAYVLSRPMAVWGMEVSEVERLSENVGQEYGICPEFLQAVAWYESSYREDVSIGGCEGLMQISGFWHQDRMERLGVQDLYDPESNMRVAADYLLELFEKWGDPAMVLMVYNGDSSAGQYWETGEGVSVYASNILELSEQLEREHGK